jgi:tyrosyl-DNA phosphodiesterase-1
MTAQGSSTAMYTTQWFNQFYLSASGHASALHAHMDLSEGRRKKLPYPAGVKVVFPSLDTVKSTAGHV